MSDPTDVNQSQSDAADDDAGTRRSRRAMRQAERAAEREAILTGQQPLLTRRELKRLRQEAAALRAAVAAGEITPEQARALQDPLAEQPEIETPSLEATGSHAASHEGRAAQADNEPTAFGTASRGESLPDASLRGQYAPGESTVPASSFDEAGAARVLQIPEHPPASRTSEAEAWTSSAHDDEAGTRGAGATAFPGVPSTGDDSMSPVAAPAHRTDGTGGDESGSWQTYSRASEPPTPMAAPPVPGSAPGPVIGQGGDSNAPGAAASFTSPGAGVVSGPEASAEPFAEPAPQVANTSLSDDDIEDISAQPTGVMNAVDASALSPLPLAPATDEPAGMPERRSLFNRDTPAPGAETGPGELAPSGADGYEGYAPGAAAPTSSGADGYEGYAPGAAAPTSSGADGYEGYAPGGSAEVEGLPEWDSQAAGGPPRRPTVRIPNAAQGVRTVDTNTGELSDVRPVDEEFDGIDNPQWRILRPEAARPDAPSDEPEAPVAEEPASAPPFTPYEPMPEAAVREPQPPEPQFPEPTATAPADSGAGWSAPAPTSSPMSPVSEPPKTSRMGKILLIVLIVVVVALVILTVVWFFLNRGSDSSASALGSVPTWTSLIG